MQVTVYARNNDEPGNRDVISYLRAHMTPLVKSGVRFKFTIVEDADLKTLLAEGMNKFPTMVSPSRKYVGSVEIAEALTQQINAHAPKKSRFDAAGPRRRTTPEDELREMYESEMNLDKVEEDKAVGDDDAPRSGGEKSIGEQASYEWKRRQEEHEARKNKPSSGRKRTTSRASDNIDTPVSRGTAHKQLGGEKGNPDDALLEQMFETSE